MQANVTHNTNADSDMRVVAAWSKGAAPARARQPQHARKREAIRARSQWPAAKTVAPCNAALKEPATATGLWPKLLVNASSNG